MFKGDSTFSRIEDDYEINERFNLTNHPVIQQIEEDEHKHRSLTRGQQASNQGPSILEESKMSSLNNNADILGEFAREQQLAEEREDLENDILRDFERLKVNGSEEPPDETFLQDASFRSTAVY